MSDINPRFSEFQEYRQAVRELCARFGSQYWQDVESEGGYPEAFVKALTEAGWLSALIPEQYGGGGLTVTEASVVLEEINRSGANSGACHAQMYVMGALVRHGSDRQKQQYLPAIAAGELRLQSFAVTEPTTGTDTTKIKTVAERKGGRYVINGQKVWISRVQHSDLMLLLARTTALPEVKKKTEGLSMFLVDLRGAESRGMTIRPIRNMVNHETNEVFFDNFEVEADALVGQEGQGFRYILDGMNAERILIAAECVGDARWFIDKARGYACERRVFGRPIGQNQGVQFPIARAFAQSEAADLMVRRAAGLFDAGARCGAEANMAKLLASEASWAAGEACLQTHGGYGFAEDFDVERKFRETRLYQVAPVSTNLILSYLAEHVLELPRSY
jgi:acyl-CoA dehydrogenase